MMICANRRYPDISCHRIMDIIDTYRCKEILSLNTSWIKHRAIVAAYYRSANAYSALVKRRIMSGMGLTSLDMQILEMIVEHEGENRNMKWFAQSLGINTSVFTTKVNELESKGLVAKYHTADNLKNIILKVTEAGEAEYAQYVANVMPSFQPIFEQLDRLSEDDRRILERALTLWGDGHYSGLNKERPELIPVTSGKSPAGNK